VIGFSVERLHQKLGAAVSYMTVGDNESVRGKDKSRSTSRWPQLSSPVAPEDFNLHHRAAGPRRYAGYHPRVGVQRLILQGRDITAARFAAWNFMIQPMQFRHGRFDESRLPPDSAKKIHHLDTETQRKTTA